MLAKLRDLMDKQGNPIEVIVAEGPQDCLAKNLTNFLSHKTDVFKWQISTIFSRDISPAKARVYLAKTVTGQILSTVITIECTSIGIFGHVFTEPGHRRRGLSRILCEETVSDFKKRGGKILNLGAAYGGFPFKLYESVGFKPLWQTGFMRYEIEGAREYLEGLYAYGETEVGDGLWSDYPVLSDVTLREGGSKLRSVAFGAIGPTLFESAFVQILKRVEDFAERSQFSVLRKKDLSVPVGYVSLFPDPMWANRTFLLDVFTHRNFERDYGKLLESISFPPRKTITFAIEEEREKTSAIISAGFRREGTLNKQIGKGENVAIFGLAR